MCWGAVAAAVVSVVAAQEAHRQQLGLTPKARPQAGPLDRLVREHQARVIAETNKTLRRANVGMFLLLAMLIAASACVYQLFA